MMEMRRSACFSINLEQAWVGMKWIAGLVNDEQLADWWLKLTWNFHGLETGCLQPQQGTAYYITRVCVWQTHIESVDKVSTFSCQSSVERRG